VSVNGTDLGNMSRIEAWNFLKTLPVGGVDVVVRR
jgi:hypothetical protein